MKKKAIKIIKKAAVAILTVACLFALFLPFPAVFSGAEYYECVWSDGSVTKESYASAYRSLTGTDGESVLLVRSGLTGRIESKAKRAYEILKSGNLLEILECSADGTRIDAAALYREFSNRVWYNGSYFVWTGEKVERVSRAKGEEIVFLEGSVTSRVLNATNATTVYLRAGAQINAAAFADSRVKTVYAEAPYMESEGAIYLNTAGGKRLLAALGGVTELCLDADLKFADEGALLACNSLVSLSLPFVGSAESTYGAEYAGELAYLFSTGKEYRVPETLARIEVTGGRIASYAFYACPNIKEIDACKVPEGNISETAFAGLTSLEILHTPKRDVILTGNFTSHTAECGCTVYTRI